MLKHLSIKNFALIDSLEIDFVSGFSVITGETGTGKSVYSHLLQQKYKTDDCKIISRDKIRGNILWELRKEEPKDQKEKIQKLDKLVSKKVIEEINNIIKENKYKGVIIDGCHTHWKTLSKLLDFLQPIENSVINLLIVGNHFSEINYNISNREEGDYGDYDANFNHNSIPFSVLTRKREEMKELFTHYFEFMQPFIDYIFFLPNRSPQK